MDLGIGVIGFYGHASMALLDWDLLSARDIHVKLMGVTVCGSSNISSPWQDHLNQSGGQVFKKWQDLIDSPEIDIVVVDGPFNLHATMALHALNVGKYVFCEKAIALNWSDYHALSGLIENGSPFLWAMFSMRYHASFYTLLQAVNNGAVGVVKNVRVQKSYKHGIRPDWYSDRDAYGGTALWVGSHAVDLLIGAAGAVESVQAVHECADKEYEMLVQAQCLHTNGIMSSLSLDFYQPDSAKSHSDDRMRVVGTNGVIEACHGSLRLVNENGEQQVTLNNPPCRTFADGVVALVNGREPLVSTAELLEITKTCLAIRDSADKQGELQRLSLYQRV